MGETSAPKPDVEKVTMLVANHPHHRWIREGAKVYIGHDTDPNANILSRSVEVLIWKNRRWARLWVRLGRLYNARIVEECLRPESRPWRLRLDPAHLARAQANVDAINAAQEPTP